MLKFDEIQFKRGDKARNDRYIGKPGSLSIDQETLTMRVHDGVTPGGLFSITRAGQFDGLEAEFILAGETFTASTGQTDFTPTTLPLDDASQLKVKVNGLLTNNWSLSGNENDGELDGGAGTGEEPTEPKLTLNDPVTEGDTVYVYHFTTLAEMMHAEMGNVPTVEETNDFIAQAFKNATSVGGLAVDDILTVNDRIDCGIIN